MKTRHTRIEEQFTTELAALEKRHDKSELATLDELKALSADLASFGTRRNSCHLSRWLRWRVQNTRTRYNHLCV